jgi:hypothetical protein
LALIVRQLGGMMPTRQGKVDYPVKQDEAQTFSPYFHSSQIIKLFAKFYGMREFGFEHLDLVQTKTIAWHAIVSKT